MKVEFDTIINAVGSGGTYAGLYIGNELNRTKKQIDLMFAMIRNTLLRR